MTEEALSGDVITTARLRQGDVEITSGTRGGVSFKTAQLPIDVYLKRRIISQDEYRVANKLFRDFSMSGQTTGVTIDLDPLRGGGKGFTECQLEARERWRNAMQSIDGMVGKLMALNVICYGYWLKEINYLPYRIGINNRVQRFKLALGDLINHYEK